LAVLGKHVILEMWGCCRNTIDNVDAVKEILIKATEAVKATLVDVVCHRFSPHGVTGVAILAESHIAIHTWPEHGYAAADIFICGSVIEPRNAATCLAHAFSAKETSLIELKRGDLASKKIPPSETSAGMCDSHAPAYL